jgi:hypothetical protein
MLGSEKIENMNDEPKSTPGLPNDWKPPLRQLQQKVWADLPDRKRERLEGLDRERDANDDWTWQQQLEDDPDDETWTVLWLRTVDPRDQRPDERIGRWPKSLPEDALARARAIVNEHRLD